MTQLKSDEFLVGYARVSTNEQSLDLQVDALKRAGVEDDHIHQEHVSGAARKRPMLELALMDLREGDVFVVWRLDRLARSLKDLINRVEQIEAKGAGLRSLSESIDTTTAGGRLILHVMGAIAEFERQLIVERTTAGMKAAIARGAKPGQPAKMTPDMVLLAQKMRDKGKTANEVIAALKTKFKEDVSKATIYNYTVGPLGGPPKRKLKRQ